MKIEQNTFVAIDYTIEVKNGETPQGLRKGFSARFVYGKDPILPALERALMGREQGEEVHVVIPPEQSFGKYDPGLVNKISLEHIHHPDALKEGEYYEEPGPDGRAVRFLVREIHDDYVLADFNHPAAGKTLVLKAMITEVRQASTEEVLNSLRMACAAGGG